MLITLPWPDRRLLPNARVHWAVKAPITKQARHNACYAVLEAAGSDMPQLRAMAASADRIPLEVRFYPPDRRKRDDDGMVGSFKALRDGIADALGLDDNRFRPHYFFEDAAKPGRIEVKIFGRDAGDKFFPQAPWQGVENERAGLRQQPRTGPDHDERRRFD